MCMYVCYVLSTSSVVYLRQGHPCGSDFLCNGSQDAWHIIRSIHSVMKSFQQRHECMYVWSLYPCNDFVMLFLLGDIRSVFYDHIESIASMVAEISS